MEPLSHSHIALVMHHLPLYRQVVTGDFRNLAEEYPDINPTHMHALMFLMINGETTMTRLSRLLRLEKGSVTSVVGRLLDWGLVSKETDPADRRQAILRLTERGRHFAESARERQRAHFAQRIGRLSDAEQQQFFDCLAQLEVLLKQMADPDQLRSLFPMTGKPCCHASHPGKDNQTNDSHADPSDGGIIDA